MKLRKINGTRHRCRNIICQCTKLCNALWLWAYARSTCQHDNWPAQEIILQISAKEDVIVSLPQDYTEKGNLIMVNHEHGRVYDTTQILQKLTARKEDLVVHYKQIDKKIADLTEMSRHSLVANYEKKWKEHQTQVQIRIGNGIASSGWHEMKDNWGMVCLQLSNVEASCSRCHGLRRTICLLLGVIVDCMVCIDRLRWCCYHNEQCNSVNMELHTTRNRLVMNLGFVEISHSYKQCIFSAQVAIAPRSYNHPPLGPDIFTIHWATF